MLAFSGSTPGFWRTSNEMDVGHRASKSIRFIPKKLFAHKKRRPQPSRHDGELSQGSGGGVPTFFLTVMAPYYDRHAMNRQLLVIGTGGIERPCAAKNGLWRWW